MNEVLYGGQNWLRPLCIGLIPAEGLAPQPNFVPIQISGSSFVLADKLAGCRFVYLEEGTPLFPNRWIDTWVDQTKWPIAVRILLRPLATNVSTLQPTSLTVPVPVNPLPGVDYHE